MDQHLIAVLLSWTVSLSQYDHPGTPPEIEFKPRSFFIETACLGNERCKAAAWYDYQGVIYLDELLKDRTDAITRSVVVHEMAHYLQDISGEYKIKSCEINQRLEREAYSIQRQYLRKIANKFASIYYSHVLPCKKPTEENDNASTANNNT